MADTTTESGNGRDTAITLVGDFDARWRLEAEDLKSLRSALGGDVLVAFCRAFVHSDRLTSLAQLFLLNHSHLPQESVAQGRNTLTILWLLAGTLREMALALKGLRSALAKRGWLDKDSGPVTRLRDFESRWEEGALFRAIRNTGAFHVDPQVIEVGLNSLASQPGPVLVAEGVGGTDHEMSCALGGEALLRGMHEDSEALRAALRSVHPDHTIYLDLQHLFVFALQKADVVLDRFEWPGQTKRDV